MAYRNATRREKNKYLTAIVIGLHVWVIHSLGIIGANVLQLPWLSPTTNGVIQAAEDMGSN